MEQVISRGAPVVAPAGGPGWMRPVARALAAAAIVSSALHFWPFEGKRVWELLTPANSAIAVWLAVLAFGAARVRSGAVIAGVLPHLSVMSYLCVAVLSVGVAPLPARAATYAAKLLLVYAGGYTLMKYAAEGEGRRLMHSAACVALAAAVACCLGARFSGAPNSFGFFGNAHKYGSYVGILTPLCAGVLLVGRTAWRRKALGFLLVAASAASVGSLGGLAALGTGLVVCFALARGAAARLAVAASAVSAAVAVAAVLAAPWGAHLRADARLKEADGANVRQRYIEWQAAANVMEQCLAAGTGAGSLNTFRSMYYYRLPKLNTVGAYEQNGWLAVGAETGVLGLVCFCAIILHYGGAGMRARRAALPASRDAAGRAGSLAALSAACVANVFSSFQYNGILIIFVFILALLGSAESGDCLDGSASENVQ